jgi:peroxiredoxin
VLLSDELLATCLIKVGDAMPDGELPDREGKMNSLRSMLGKKLTVVFFWTAEDDYSLKEVEDLNAELDGPLGAEGVKVVGIDHGDTPAKVREALKKRKLKYPVLLDPDGKYFAKVAKQRVLRTYLLDAKGKVLWFDLEYARSTRRQLVQAVQVALGKGDGGRETRDKR